MSSPLGSLHADRAEIRALRAELAREVETRENANAVSVRVEAENRLLKEECELAAEQGRLVGLQADRYRQALDMAIYHADNLQRYIDRKPVRDLAESRAGLEAAREVFEEAESA